MPFVLSNMRAALIVTALLAVPAFADECTDDYAECKDGCLIEFGGSVQLDQKKKYEKCANKCTKTARRCSERVMETRNNQLDEGALDGTPASDETDRDGMPTRSGASAKKKKARDTEETTSSSTEDSSAPREALRSDEVPKSNRTKLKVDESAPPPKKEEEPAKTTEEPQKSDVIEMKISKKKGNSGGDELRDDGPRAQPKQEEEAPPPSSRRKKKEPTDDAPKPKRDEDHDDLRNF